MALVGRGTGPSVHRGLGAGRLQRRHRQAAMAGLAAPLPAALLVFYRLAAGLRTGLAALAAPALPQRRRTNQHRRSGQLRPAPAVRRAGAQILLLQQKPVDARGPN